jgi:hypothetical protein
MDAADLAQLVQRLDRLTTTLGIVGNGLEKSAIHLQEKMDTAADRLAGNLDKSVTALVKSLDASANAANRYAGRLVFATWALVAATLVLATIPVVEAAFPSKTPRQRECAEFSAAMANRAQGLGKDTSNTVAVNSYLECLAR